MTPMQKKVEKLEQEMKYVKKVADSTKVVNEKVFSLLFDWLNDNLTDEQKDSLGKFILTEEELNG